MLTTIPVVAADPLVDLPPVGTVARNVLENCLYKIDGGAWSTAVADGGAGHLQGICSDDEQEYMYMSFTNMLVKVDMRTGEIAGTVKGLAAGSISSGAHIGCLAYHDGKIYGSLEYKAAERWYICVFDGDKIWGDMDYTDEGVMYGLYVPQVGDDFKNELIAGEHNNNADSMGHRYGTGGIDGITFGTLPGKGYDTDGDGVVDIPDENTYMIVTYGPYGNAKRYDNENFVFLVYDPLKIDDKNLLPFNESRLTADIQDGEEYLYEHKMFCYAGNQTYGVQNLEFDKDTGDLWLECYGRPSGSEFPNFSRFVIDGSVPLYMDEVEVGQSVTGNAAGFITKEDAIAIAQCYNDYDDVDEDGDTEEQELGWHMTLKCICGKGNIDKHSATVYGETGHPCQICGSSSSFTTGLISLGNDYFYGATSGSKTIDGKSHEWGEANLYKLDRSGAYTFNKVGEPAKLLMRYSMDAADTYESGGQVYIKDASGNGYDALIEGTYAAEDKDGNPGAALGFRGDEYGDVLDRVHMSDEAMEYINSEVKDSFSYSFWMYNGKEMDRFTPIIGMYRDEDVQKNLYAGVFEWRYRNSPAIVVHRNTETPLISTWEDGSEYIVKPSTVAGGDGSTYFMGNGEATGLMERWDHYVVVRDSSTITVYRNGEATKSNNSNISNSTLDNLSAFEIGGYIARNWVDSNVRARFTGLIDDVQIYSGILSMDQAKALYEEGPLVSNETGTGAVATNSDKTFGTYTGEVLSEQSDPILYYKMDQTGTVIDSSGNQKDAIATPWVTTAGADESQTDATSLYFDGRVQVKPTKVSLSDDDTAWLSAQINNTKKFTISFWMNAAMENSHRMSILGMYGKDGRPIGAFETRGTLGQDVWMDGKFAIGFSSAKPYSGTGYIDEATYEQLAVTATTPTYDNPKDDRNDLHYGDKIMGNWYHVVGELDQVENKMRLYIDGSLASEIDIANDTLGEIGYFMVGQPAGRYYEYENAASGSENSNHRQGWAMRDGFVGRIDELKVYNRILSNSEVLAQYNAGLVTGITLDKSVLSLLAGATEQLTATVQPESAINKTISWRSSDNAVATVENGVVQAVGEGTAIIIASTVDGEHMAFCSVTVRVPVSSVKLDQSTLGLKVGETATLTATVEPENATNTELTWNSSNETVATITDGVVKAVGEGTATITVTTVDGGYTATCEVTVTKKSSGGSSTTKPVYPPTVYYDITVTAGEGGTVTPNGTIKVESGSNKTVSITPNKGYRIGDVLVDGTSVGAVSEYIFKNVSKNASLEAKFIWENPFTDVSEDSWYYDAVKFCVQRGIFVGASDTTFEPTAPTTRAMVVTVLGRLANIDIDSFDKSSFEDVPVGTWYSPYVEWAMQNNIVYGYGNGNFGPQDLITREQTCAIIARYCKYANIELHQINQEITFVDDSQISQWAREDVKKAQMAGLIYGGNNNMFAPLGEANRAQVASILMRLIEDIIEK